MRAGVLATAAVLLVAGAALLPAAPAATTPSPRLALVIDAGRLGSAEPLAEWGSKRPGLADVDGDGDLDLLAQNQNGWLYVIDLVTGKALLETRPRYPYGPDLGPFNGPKAADLDGDGRVEIVNVNRAAVVSVWRVEGTEEATGKLQTTLLWDKHLTTHHGHPSADAGPVLGDLDGDGTLEIVVQTEETGVYALRHNGSILWSLAEWGGNAEAVLEDVDRNGSLDAVFFTDGGVAYAVDGPSGRVLWRFQARHHGVWPGSAASPGVVADIDGDGRVEAVFCARNVENATEAYAPGAPWYRQHHFALLASREGKLLWMQKPSWGNPLCSAYLASADVDGDGKRELFGMDWNTIGHKPGNWELTGPPHVFAFRHDGTELWHVSSDHGNAKPHISVADWDGDGVQDIIAYGRSKLVVLDALKGTEKSRITFRGWEVKQGPLLADVTGDGTLEAIVAVQGASNAFLLYNVGSRATASAFAGWEPPARDPPGDPPPVARSEAGAAPDSGKPEGGAEPGTGASPGAGGAGGGAQRPPPGEEPRAVASLPLAAVAAALVAGAFLARRRR